MFRSLVRMAMMARHRRSTARLVVAAGAIAIALAVAAIDKAGYWPSALSVEKSARTRVVPGIH